MYKYTSVYSKDLTTANLSSIHKNQKVDISRKKGGLCQITLKQTTSTPGIKTEWIPVKPSTAYRFQATAYASHHPVFFLWGINESKVRLFSKHFINTRDMHQATGIKTYHVDFTTGPSDSKIQLGILANGKNEFRGTKVLHLKNLELTLPIGPPRPYRPEIIPSESIFDKNT